MSRSITKDKITDYNISVKFKNYPALNITLDNNSTASAWLALFKKNYQQEFPIFRDQKKYTVAYLNQLARVANSELGWDCETNITSLKDTVRLHKNLERTLTNGFDSIPAIYDDLVHELHFCLHKTEHIDHVNNENYRHYLQFEWFNNEGFPLDLNFKHKININFGDIRLQNPYVGHIPLQIFEQDDKENVFLTCKFHDFVRPGLYIHTGKNYTSTFNLEEYLFWWYTYAPEFIAKHGEEKILHYTGHPIIGQVKNLEILEKIVNSKDILKLEYISTI